jgi:hypothetical protein
MLGKAVGVGAGVAGHFGGCHATPQDLQMIDKIPFPYIELQIWGFFGLQPSSLPRVVIRTSRSRSSRDAELMYGEEQLELPPMPPQQVQSRPS